MEDNIIDKRSLLAHQPSILKQQLRIWLSGTESKSQYLVMDPTLDPSLNVSSEEEQEEF